MKAKAILFTSVLLIVCLMCGCGAQPAPTESTAGTARTDAVATEAQSETQTTDTTSAVPDDLDEAKLYADYLTGGGYDEIMDAFFDGEEDYEAQAVLADVNGDGVRELLMHIADRSMGGVRGYASVSFLLGVRDGQVERLGFAYYGGGTGGGDYLFIKYDTATDTHVLEYEEYVRDGMFFNTYALHFFDFSRRDTEPKEYGLVGAGDVVYKTAHTLRSNTCYTEGTYAQDAQRVLGETDLCKQEDGFVTAYLYDDEYISEAEYDEMCARFVEPTDPAYQMKPVTMDNPIPG